MRSTSRALCAFGLLSAALAAAGCSKKKTSPKGLAEGASITISGTLALTDSSTTSASNLAEFGLAQASNLSPQDLKVYCVSFAFPPKAGNGNVDANGAFSLNIEANDVAVGCFILNGTATVASMVFEDTAGTNVDGAAKSDSRLAFSGSTNMGTINVDTATGKAKVNVAGFKAQTKTFGGNGFDFTGTWKIKASDNIPTGYVTAQTESACAFMNQGGGGSGGAGAQLNPQSGTPPTPEQIEACQGPRVDEKIYFKRIAGKKMADNSDAFAMAVWKSKAAFEACGSKIGFDINLAKTKTGVDFTSSGLENGPFSWTPGWEKGWKFSGATTQERPKCKPAKINVSGTEVEFMKCSGNFVDSSTKTVVTPNIARIDLNTRDSGCRDGSGKPAQIQDWSTITWNSSTTPCVPKLNGLVEECTHTGSYAGGTVTCKNTGGFVNASNTRIDPPSGQEFMVENETAGAPCSSISDEMDQLRCYAEYYNNAATEQENTCIAEVNLNWAAATSTDFVIKTDGPTRAQNQYVFNLLNYTSASTASVRDEKVFFLPAMSGSKDGGESFVNCKFAASNDIAITKLSETEVLFDLIMQQKSLDKNPACNSLFAMFGGGDNGKAQKFLFKATKESN